MPIPDLSLVGWLVLALSAFVIGVAKTSIGGMGALAVAGFAMFLPAKESTAAVLLLLLVGDVVAVALYRKSADWKLLRRLLPAVLPGIVLGAVLMGMVNNQVMTLLIAACILIAVAIQVAMRRRVGEATPGTEPPTIATIGAGIAAGFTTMVANAAGPVTALYLLAARVDKMRFVGTSAWFYLLVNLAKTPFSGALGLFPATTLSLTLILTPVVLLGAAAGRVLLRRLDQRYFEGLTLAASLFAGIALLVRGLT